MLMVDCCVPCGWRYRKINDNFMYIYNNDYLTLFFIIHSNSTQSNLSESLRFSETFITEHCLILAVAMDLFDSSKRWRWRWDDFCGPEGFKIWSAKRHDFGLCFQHICLHIPILAILACASSYYYGRRVGFVRRGATQLIAINMRCLTIIVSTFLPLLQIYIYLNKTDVQIEPVSYLLYAVEGIAWFTHLIYSWGLRKRLGLSPRGPIVVTVIWTSLFVIDVISLRTRYLMYSLSEKPDYSVFVALAFSVCNMVLQVVYGITLFPGQGSTVFVEYSSVNYSQVSG